MTTREWLHALFTGIFAALFLATLLGILLRQRRGKGHAAIENYLSRLRAWWFMVGFLALAMALGKPGLVSLFAFISFQALREFISLTHTRRGDHRALVWTFFLFLPLQYLLIASEWYGLFSILIPVYAFLLLPISSALGNDTTRFLERTAKVQWGLMICVYCLSHVPALLTLNIKDYEGRNLLLVLFLLLTVQSSDVFQYVSGRLFGRHLLAPAISPSKTVEGLLGGVACSSAVGAALYPMTPFSPLQAAGMALAINILGFFGGFVLSAIKRDRGVKDWGTLIEGHGGMLDRVDSITFSAPIFFHMVRFWFV